MVPGDTPEWSIWALGCKSDGRAYICCVVQHSNAMLLMLNSSEYLIVVEGDDPQSAPCLGLRGRSPASRVTKYMLNSSLGKMICTTRSIAHS